MRVCGPVHELNSATGFQATQRDAGHPAICINLCMAEAHGYPRRSLRGRAPLALGVPEHIPE
jgi:hypothetical protein